jgi:hypothetical protein
MLAALALVLLQRQRRLAWALPLPQTGMRVWQLAHPQTRRLVWLPVPTPKERLAWRALPTLAGRLAWLVAAQKLLAAAALAQPGLV